MLLSTFEMSVVERRKGCGQSQTACARAGLVGGGRNEEDDGRIGGWRKLEGPEKKNWMNYR